MKNKLWLLQIPLVVLFTGAFYLSEMGYEGKIHDKFWRDTVYANLQRVSAFVTDSKFKARGPQAPKNNIVIVEIDSDAIDKFGRWPWHRDATAQLINKTFEAGAKVVGLDMVFSEQDKRVPDDLAQLLTEKNLGDEIMKHETDVQLAQAIQAHADRLVMGWASEAVCSPLFLGATDCPVSNPDAIKSVESEQMDKFALGEFKMPAGFDAQKTPLLSTPTVLNNFQLFSQLSKHAGYFYAYQDPDGYIRRTPFVLLANSKPYPALPLEVARIGLGEELTASVGDDLRIKEIGFKNSGRRFPASPLGFAEVNYRGPGRTFKYLPAADVMKDDDKIEDAVSRKLAGLSKKDVLKDAYVLIGITALGVFDMRAFPFDSSSAGVEGHANLLDNILSGDFLVRYGDGNGSLYLFLLMTVGALAFCFAAQKMQAIPGLLLASFVLGGFGFADFKVLFAQHNINWDSSFFYLEIFSLFVLTVAAKYVMEERSKKFVKGAFAKYVAPAVVDSILKDPAKLTVGGEKKELTILFSDIRGFTSFSEKMDAKALSSFLNDYLGVMTEIVFKNGGTLDKYIGDAVMAFWGAPLDQKQHASNACKAAAEMMVALNSNRERWKKQFGLPVEVEIGIGINSGTVSVGNMGSQNNFSYTVIGDSVNLASRLEGLTKEYRSGIVTSRFTFDDIVQAGLPLPQHRVLDFVKVKGKKKAVELIQVLDQLSAEGVKQFDEGRALYTQRKWSEAIVKFKSSNDLIARANGADKDGPSQMFIERCEAYRDGVEPDPGEGWDGSHVMHSK